jgi:hypothetical protein
MDYSLRKSSLIDEKAIQVPLLFLRPQFGYTMDSILRKIESSPEIYIEPTLFPFEIKEYFWIHEGLPGQSQWIALGKLNNDMYFLYTAYMTLPLNTFVNNGHMNLWISIRFSDLIQFAMDSSMYSLYISETRSMNVDI